MRRKREPGTRKPLSCPLSKQRMIVCWLTLQIFAASPVVKTVFVVDIALIVPLRRYEIELPTSARSDESLEARQRSAGEAATTGLSLRNAANSPLRKGYGGRRVFQACR